MGWTVAQTQSATFAQGSTTINLPSTVTASNDLILITGTHYAGLESDFAQTITGAGVTWTLQETVIDPNSSSSSDIYIRVYSGKSAGGNGVVITTPGVHPLLSAWAVIAEVSGFGATEVIDTIGTDAAQGPGASVSSPTLTTTVGGDLIIMAAVNGDLGGALTGAVTGSGFSVLGTMGPSGGVHMLAVIATTLGAGVQSCGFPLASSGYGSALGVAYKGASTPVVMII